MIKKWVSSQSLIALIGLQTASLKQPNLPVFMLGSKKFNELVNVKCLGSSSLNAENTQFTQFVVCHSCAQMGLNEFESEEIALTCSTVKWTKAQQVCGYS